MKNKMITIFPIFFLFFGASFTSNDTAEGKVNFETLFKEKRISEIRDNSNFTDSLSVIMEQAYSVKDIVLESKNKLKVSKAKRVRLSRKTKSLEQELDTMIHNVTKDIEYNYILKTKEIKYDSICLKKRNIIARFIFGKDDCKEWQVKKYYIDQNTNNRVYVKRGELNLITTLENYD